MGEKTRLNFKVFPAYADYLIKNKLREFTEEQLRLTFEVDLPILKYYDLSPYTHEQLVELSIPSYLDFLNHIVNNKSEEFITESIKKWVANQLPNITRDQLVVKDVTLATYIRKIALLHFIPSYTSLPSEIIELAREIEDFSLEAISLSFSSYVDIHQDKIQEMNTSLQKNREQLLEAQEMASLGSFEWDMTESGHSSFTPQALAIFEMEKASKLSEFLNYVHPSEHQKLKYALNESLLNGGKYNCEYRYNRNGKEKIIWSRGIIEFKDATPILMRGTIIDVTDRTLMLQRLQDNEALYKQAQKLTHIGNWSWDTSSGIVNWSDELYRIYGLEPQQEEITLEKFLSFIHPEDLEMRKKQIENALKTGIADDYIMRIITTTGEIKVLRGKGEVVFDHQNKVNKIIGTCQDITKEDILSRELKKREENLALLNDSLKEKNKELTRSNEELKSFSYVASHDLQEPLRKIKTFSELLIEKELSKLSPEGKHFLDRIGGSALHMQKLIQDLLGYSRTQVFTDTKQVINLSETLEGIKNTHHDMIKNKELEFHYEQLPVIKGVPVQLQQLFENLVSNSIKYRQSGIPVKIDIRSEKINGSILTTLNADKIYFKISVSDNGIGFDQIYSQKIFEIFQRLHNQSAYSGTGIGLAICKKIVENHGGFISAKGELKKGSVFEIYFPEQ